MWLQPGAACDELVGWQDEALRIRVAAPPVAGQANKALVKLLATWLEVSPSQLAILRGRTSRRKLIRITGVSAAELQARLDDLGRS